MKLAVSNIAWTDDLQDHALEVLSQHAVKGIEVAPTRLWPAWEGMSVASAAVIRDRMGESGFQIPSMQSLLFGMPQLNVFGDEATQAALLSHLERLFPVARALGVRALVFGSPRNRDRSGLTDEQAFSQAVAFFRRVAQRAHEHQVILCMEPNPPQYGANFVTGWRDALALVQAVDAPGFGLHLDTACIHMNGDDPAQAIQACADSICHFHISEPQLADLSSPQVDHQRAANALRSVGYEGWISIEMRCGDTPIASLDGALRLVRETYLSDRAMA